MRDSAQRCLLKQYVNSLWCRGFDCLPRAFSTLQTQTCLTRICHCLDVFDHIDPGITLHYVRDFVDRDMLSISMKGANQTEMVRICGLSREQEIDLTTEEKRECIVRNWTRHFIVSASPFMLKVMRVPHRQSAGAGALPGKYWVCHREQDNYLFGMLFDINASRYKRLPRARTA